jgi:anti-sigma B factor antagonist
VSDELGPLELTVAQSDAVASVTVRGEVDIHTCGELEKMLTDLADHGARTITIDLSQVAFIDSSGLRALVVGHKALRDQGGSLVISNPSASTARLFEVTGLDGLFEVEA